MSTAHGAKRVLTPAVLLFLMGNTLTAATVFAQDAAPETDAPPPVEMGGEVADDERARQAYQRGRALFEARKYDESAEAFDEAYQLSKRPLLLLSIASAHERAGRFDLALRTLRAYKPYANPQNAGEVDYRIASLEERVEVVETKQADGGPSLTATADAPRSTRSFNYVGWVSTGVGVAALGTGVTFLILGDMDHQDVATSKTPEEAQDLIDSGDQKKLIGGITAGVGGAAVVAGVVLLVTGIGTHEVEAAPATTFNFSPLPGGGMVSFQGRF